LDSQVTQLLARIREGDSAAAEELMPLVYSELHRIAAGRMQRENAGHTLQPTALVNEVYMRVFHGKTPAFTDRAHFLAVASQIMRRLLVDHARAKATEKRGGALQRMDSDKAAVVMQGPEWKPVDLLELNDALEELAAESPNLARAVELHHFGGLTAEETAVATNRSLSAVRHDLRFAHAWLRRRLASS
jgi:RNA polymerase sigma factor (TIGR02999 family)